MSTFCFSVQSDAVPCALPRVLEVFAMHGFVPEQCHASRTGDLAGELVVDLQLDEIDAAQAALLAKRLGRVVSVTGVLYSEKRRCLAA
jgi:acetolactate synthase regulatory subunit